MQSEAQLTPVFPQFDQAIFSNLNLSLVNKLTLNGNNGNDGNVYTNGDLVMKNNTSVSGNVYAQGSATVQSSIIRATLWANGPVSLDSTTVFGDVLSSTGTVTISNNSHVYGSVKALGAITVSGNSQVDGQRVTGVNLGPPPALKFPQIGYNPTYWQSKGYVIQQYSDCTSAKNAIVAGFPSGQATVVRITSVCTLSFTNNSGATLAGDLAIITDGGFSTANQVTFTGAAANTKLYIIRPYETGLACSPPTPSPYDITLSNQSAINSINLFAYTQCTVNMGNNNSSGATAQVIAGVVNITNNMVLNYKNVTVPSDPVAYTASVSYIREVVNGTG